jgi:hypothetical protein
MAKEEARKQDALQQPTCTANAHSDQSTYEQQLDERLEQLEKLREQFGMATNE